MKADQAFTGNPEVDVLLFSWGRVMANTTGWTRGFALSIQKARRKPDWHPTPKQHAMMRRLVADLSAGAGDDIDLIEND